MSTEQIDRNADLKRLRDEGYEVEIRSKHLLIRNVPYVDSNKNVRRGTLVSVLFLGGGDQTIKPSDHVAHWIGDHPHNADGTKMEGLAHGSGKKKLADDLEIDHSFSNKPPGGYPDHYAKMIRYITMIANQAEAIDPNATARTFAVIESPAQDSPFLYTDTASSRAGIGAVSDKLKLARIVIIGLGGTGSYILDLVAKTPVGLIELWDGDKFGQHNAFRSPSAASIEDLRQGLSKVEYFAQIYGKMRRGMVPHPEYVAAENVDQLAGADFVFVCIDKDPPKRIIFNKLIELGIRFIDVGMGVTLEDETIRGQVRTTAVTPGKSGHLDVRAPLAAHDNEDDYNQNIQIADLNALNAALAVIWWKKHFGFYSNRKGEHHSVYIVGQNTIINEETAE